MKLKIGVAGAGHLGKIHIRIIKELNNCFDLIGFYDPNQSVANEVSKEYGIPSFDTVEELIGGVDCLDVVTATLSHFSVAKIAIQSRKHVFIEKPLSETIEEAYKLQSLVHEADIVAQVGHVERFNPAFIAAQGHLERPMFIETHRLAQFNPRGTDVPVVLDLMIHDIDIILSVVNSPIKKIDASGVAVISETPDISNARIEFENGCVANLTASRISLKKMRKTRFFQKNAYIAVDFLTKKVEVVKIKDAPEITDDLALLLTNAEGEKKQIYFENPEIHDSNAIQEELEHFADCIHNNNTPLVSLKDGAKALAVAHQIIACIG